MNFKNKMLAVVAAGALTAAAVPAMAVENQFSGMYRFMFYGSNFFNGVTYSAANANAHLADPAHSGTFAEQRARLMYTAKASDDLKMVTHFELDSRFGGMNTTTGYKGTSSGNDAGQLDADSLSLETKNVYLDFNDPFAKVNFKVGLQPWADAYKSVFLLADMTGVYATKKFGAATGSLGWFRYFDTTAGGTNDVGHTTADLIVLDSKYAVNPNTTVGFTYYNIQNDVGAAGGKFELLHMIGLNASIKAGPATIDPWFAYQFGENALGKNDIAAYMLGATAKIKAGPGNVNVAALYLSGDKTTDTKEKDFKQVSGNTSYFNAANMWFLVRNAAAVNSSTSVVANDLTVGGLGFMGLFAGYEGAAGKVFYSGNLGYAQTAVTPSGKDGDLGVEVNATVGYKLYDNLSASGSIAYLAAGGALGGSKSLTGKASVDDPWLFNVNLSYNF